MEMWVKLVKLYFGYAFIACEWVKDMGSGGGSLVGMAVIVFLNGMVDGGSY